MTFAVCFISLITIYTLQITYSQSSKAVPGCSACTYFVSIEENCQPNVPVNELPQECTSYTYFDVRPDDSFNVGFGNPYVNNDEFLKSLLGKGKSMFLYYIRQDATIWIPALQSGVENFKTEMANLKTFLEPYKNISGLIIGGLTMKAGNYDSACITDNFKAYLNEMRTCFPEYSIGFDIYGYFFLQFYEQPNPPENLDFSVLDPYIDFYVINLNRLNNCTEEFKVGGTVPINGTAPYTIDKLKGYITKKGVLKEKTYYMFRPGPTTLETTVDTVCDRTNDKMCGSPTLDGFCADTTQSYYDKGAYAKQYGAGFFALDPDLHDDPYGCCKCGGPYPAFHDILAGFHGDPVPPACPLLDK